MERMKLLPNRKKGDEKRVVDRGKRETEQKLDVVDEGKNLN